MSKGFRKLVSLVSVSLGGTAVFGALNIYKCNENFYENVLIPAAHKLDPESAHNLAVWASKYNLVFPSQYEDPGTLHTSVWNLNFSNPIGIAAGFDKQGEAVTNLHTIGFGFVEVGSVTPKPQPGNPKPRVVRLTEDKAVINRYGFNSDGHDAVYSRLANVKKNDPNCVLGVNLGKNKISSEPVQDYVDGIQKFGQIADYLVINISSPNTPGLRDWQHQDQLKNLLSRLVIARNNLPGPVKPPLLLKLAPDLSGQERKDIANVLSKKECKVDGLVISNTTVARPKNLVSADASEPGGLSGQPLTGSSTQLIKDMFQLTNGKIPIIGVGGVFSGKDAYEKIRAGASLIQLYTAYIYHGPPRIRRIKEELDQLLQKDGFKSISEAVGKGSS